MTSNIKSLAIISLINKFFWKTMIAPIMSITIPIMFMIIWFLIANGQNESHPDTPSPIYVSSLPSLITMSIFPFVLMSVPQMHFEFKSSILLRKIQISGVQKFQYLSLVSFYAVAISIFFTLITFSIFLAIGSSSLFQEFPVGAGVTSLFNVINWGGLIYGILMLLISSIPIGILIGIIAQSSVSSQIIGFGIFMISLAISGQMAPLSVIGEIGIGYSIITLFSPLSYSLGVINSSTAIVIEFELGSTPQVVESIFGNDPFDLFNSVKLNHFSLTRDRETGSANIFEVYPIWQKILNLVMPWVFFGIFYGITLKLFKWKSR